MAKIVICSDAHLGVSERTKDIIWAMRIVNEYAKRSGIDTIIHLGDMFHDRVAIGIDILNIAHDFFDLARKSGLRWITFIGNHDMFLRNSWSFNSLKVFKDVLTIIEDVKILVIDGVRFWILPFIHLESAYMRVLKRIEQQYQPGDVLLTHIGVFGAVKNVCFLLKDWSVVAFNNSPFEQVFTGHFHTHQYIGPNVWYPGSLIPFKFDEGDCDHGFFVYDLETRKHEFMGIWKLGQEYFPDEIPPPNYITVPDEIVDKLDDSVVRNNMIRVAVSREYTLNERTKVENNLLAAGARAVRWMSIGGEDQHSQVRSDMIGEHSEDVFESWLKIDSETNSKLDVNLLRQLHVGVAQEADEIYNYDADD